MQVGPRTSGPDGFPLFSLLLSFWFIEESTGALARDASAFPLLMSHAFFWLHLFILCRYKQAVRDARATKNIHSYDTA
jgi:hypothetical protein